MTGLRRDGGDPQAAVAGPVRLERDALASTACNGTALRKATRRVSQLYDLFLAPSGIRSTQRSILAHVDRLGSPTVGTLATALVIDRGALAHNLKPLERDGLLRTDVAPEDRRTRRVVLTESGRAKLEETRPLWARAQARFEAIVGEAQASALRRSLLEIASLDFEAAFLSPDFVASVERDTSDGDLSTGDRSEDEGRLASARLRPLLSTSE